MLGLISFHFYSLYRNWGSYLGFYGMISLMSFLFQQAGLPLGLGFSLSLTLVVFLQYTQSHLLELSRFWQQNPLIMGPALLAFILVHFLPWILITAIFTLFGLPYFYIFLIPSFYLWVVFIFGLAQVAKWRHQSLYILALIFFIPLFWLSLLLGQAPESMKNLAIMLIGLNLILIPSLIFAIVQILRDS